MNDFNFTSKKINQKSNGGKEKLMGQKELELWKWLEQNDQISRKYFLKSNQLISPLKHFIYKYEH